MQLRGKRILLISPEPWEGLHMSKHHLSQALAARGNAVYFLDPPVAHAMGILSEEHDGVTVLRYRHWLRGVNYMPAAINRWYYKRLVQQLAKHTGGAFDIIWCFDTSRMQYFPTGIGYGLLHLADYDILHMGKGLIPTADFILTTGQVVADAIAPFARSRVVNIGHALDERWMQDIDSLAERTIAEPHDAVFMGQLANSYNDWEGFHDVAASHPQMRFTFIGPYDDSFPEPAFYRLRALPNVTFTGLKQKDELVPLLRAAHILFFGFRSGTRAKERANPHKVLEYLSTGNVVVGSWTMEYANNRGLFRMADEGADLKACFDSAVRDFQVLNAPLERARRIAFAKERRMSRLIERIEAELDR